MFSLLCPRCPTTDAVWAEVFGRGFWGFSADIAIVLLPFAIVGLIAGWLYGMRTGTAPGADR